MSSAEQSPVVPAFQYESRHVSREPSASVPRSTPPRANDSTPNHTNGPAAAAAAAPPATALGGSVRSQGTRGTTSMARQSSAASGPVRGSARAATAGSGRQKAGGAVAVAAPRPPSSAANVDFTGYNFDTVKTLKEIFRRRDEATYLRTIPKSHQLLQAVAQEQSMREAITQQEATARVQLESKRNEDRAKRAEQAKSAAAKVAQEELKRSQQEELAAQKETVQSLTKQTEADVREWLRLCVMVQPRLNVVNAVLADIRNEQSTCALLGGLLEEEKKLQKALKGDARNANSKTAAIDGGALPYWFKQVIASSYNVAAIVKGVAYRAAVQDSPSVVTKLNHEKKMIVIKPVSGESVVCWAQARCGPDPVAIATAYVENKPTIAELPATAFAGVIWTKEDVSEVMAQARASGSPIAELAAQVKTTLTYGDVSSAEFTSKDITNIGETASASA